MTPETVVLPRSGAVLTKSMRCSGWMMRVDGILAIELSDAGCGRSSACIGGSDAFNDTHGECIAWLDARVLALRAALMPHDARERVAKALFDLDGPHDPAFGLNNCDDPCREQWMRRADAVLTALGVAEETT